MKKETKPTMNPVVHFEMPYVDKTRLMHFYTKTFGWQMQALGEEMGQYVTAATTEIDEKRMIQRPGVINGGFYPKSPDGPTCPSVVIAVENLTDVMTKIVVGGGKIRGEPVEISGIGRYVSFEDTEGNRVGLLQPKNM